jgi:hypothetical protein
LIPAKSVLDTKWKLIDPRRPVAEDADLHQALDYARHFKVPRVVLLYPGFDELAGPIPTVSWVTTVEPRVEVAAVQIPIVNGIPTLERAVQDAVRYAMSAAPAAAA